MRRGFILALLLLSVGRTDVAWGQFFAGPGMPVYDVANHVQNTITAIQAIAIVANQVLELTALPDMMAAEEDLAILQAILEEAAVLESDLTALVSLFGVEDIPVTSNGLFERGVRLRLAIIESYHRAMRVQTIILTVLRTIQHILTIVDHARDAIGNLSVSQSLAESQAKVQQLLAESNVRQGIFERAKSLDALEPHVLTESLRRITRTRMEQHPRR